MTEQEAKNLENLTSRYCNLVNTLCNDICPYIGTAKSTISNGLQNFEDAYSGDSLSTYKKYFTDIYDDIDSIQNDFLNKIIPELQSIISNNNNAIASYNAQVQ